MKRLILFTLVLFGAMTFVSAQTQYYLQDFEAGIPADWTVTGEWEHGDAAAITSAYFDFSANTTNFIAFNDDAQGGAHVGDGRVETGVIDLSAATGTLFMEVDVQFLNADYQGADEVAEIFITIDDGATWELLIDFPAVGLWSTQIFSIDQYAGEMVRLAFNYKDGAGWNFGYGVDNISFSDAPIYTDRRNYSFSINGGSQFTQVAANIDYQLEGVVVNNGYETINSFDVDVTRDGVTTTYNFNDMGILFREAKPYSIPDLIPSGESFSITQVAISNVNGEEAPDADISDNSKNLTFAPVNTLQEGKAVVVEEATGTWCTWCPRGTVYLDEMSKRFGDNFVGIAVHNSDPMALAAYDGAITTFPGFTGFPSVIYNRRSVMNPDAIVAPAIADMSIAPAAVLTVGAEMETGILTTSLQVDFMQDVPGANHRIAIVLTEDALQSDAPGWDQVSGAYSGGGNGPMGGFEYLPTSVPSSVWPYDHVGRALIGTYAGVNGQIAGDYVAGDTDSYFFPDFLMNSDWNQDNMHIVGLLIDASGAIVNATSVKFNDAIARGLSTGTEDELASTSLTVYPNPVVDKAIIKLALLDAKTVNATLINSLGKKVSTQSFGKISGNQELEYNMDGVNTGVYFLNVEIDNNVITKRITKS